MGDYNHVFTRKYFRVIDFFVLIVFISTAVWGLYLFRADLMNTLEKRDVDPVGTIYIKHNVVQRRHEDRVLWDRLFVDSPVYSGDLIRAADISSALIDIDTNEIYLDENTMIRIQKMSGAGAMQVELREGVISVAGGEEGKELFLDLMGRQVQTAPGALLNASVGEEGLVLQVNEGTVSFVEGGSSREISGGQAIAMDTDGTEIEVSENLFSRLFSFSTIGAATKSAAKTISSKIENSKFASTISEMSNTIATVVRRDTQVIESQPAIEPEKTEAPKREPLEISGGNRYYTVVPGDTLGKIAGKVYGEPLLWRRIFEANDIPNQDLIYPDQVFVIPF